jgi:hypothetical protein
MRWISKYGVFHDGMPAMFAAAAAPPQPEEAVKVWADDAGITANP